MVNKSKRVCNSAVALCVNDGRIAAIWLPLDTSLSRGSVKRSVETFTITFHSAWNLSLVLSHVDSAPRARGIIIKDLIINSRHACAA